MKTEIIFEDKEILVIYKPAGLAAQSAKVTQPDVVSEICGYLKRPYVGLVHRLDQPVEGLMVLGKTKEAAGNLSAQLTKGSLKKKYLAVVCGLEGSVCELSKEMTELADELLKDKKSGKMEVVTGKKQKESQNAILFYRKISEGEENTALMEIELVTGRFHQIRAQMSHAKMPLLGDTKYGTAKSQELSMQKKVRDVALCAYKLSFLHPKTKKQMEFEIKPRKPVFDSYDF